METEKLFCKLCSDETPELSDNGYCDECAKTEEHDPSWDELYPSKPVEMYLNR